MKAGITVLSLWLIYMRNTQGQSQVKLSEIILVGIWFSISEQERENEVEGSLPTSDQGVVRQVVVVSNGIKSLLFWFSKTSERLNSFMSDLNFGKFRYFICHCHCRFLMITSNISATLRGKSVKQFPSKGKLMLRRMSAIQRCCLFVDKVG